MQLCETVCASPASRRDAPPCNSHKANCQTLYPVHYISPEQSVLLEVFGAGTIHIIVRGVRVSLATLNNEQPVTRSSIAEQQQ